MEECPSKSPEKSSPSFPEDAEDDDEDNGDLIDYQTSSPRNQNDRNDDVTMVAEEDDDLEPNCPHSCDVGSPRHPADSSDRKVHWTNENVQTLLNFVEKHLEEFNIQKKHKQVWQTIGSEMQHLGFTTEHCYNKWKNLRRDVRILVNNPQKAVRNADILRRVARLILIIYPNVDATTMQVCSDRTGVRSTPCTPGGVGNSTGKSFPTMVHPDSPAFHLLANCHTPRASTPSCYQSTPSTIDHKLSMNGNHNSSEPPVPGTALFTNLGPSIHLNSTSKLHVNNSTIKVTSESDTCVTNPSVNQASPNESDGPSHSQPNLPFPFNPATTALLLQTQLFNDLLRQQQRVISSDSSNGHSHPPSTAASTSADVNIPLTSLLQTGNAVGNSCGLSASSNLPSVSLAATLLNGLVGANALSLNASENTHVGPGNGLSNAVNGTFFNMGHLNGPPSGSSESSAASGNLSSLSSSSIGTGGRLPADSSTQASVANLLERIPPGSELASVVERLRDEEAVHIRLTDMVAHLADELRAAGQRRHAVLEQLLNLVKSGSVNISTGGVTGLGASIGRLAGATGSLFHGTTSTANSGGMV